MGGAVPELSVPGGPERAGAARKQNGDLWGPPGQSQRAGSQSQCRHQGTVGTTGRKGASILGLELAEVP